MSLSSSLTEWEGFFSVWISQHHLVLYPHSSYLEGIFHCILPCWTLHVKTFCYHSCSALMNTFQTPHASVASVYSQYKSFVCFSISRIYTPSSVWCTVYENPNEADVSIFQPVATFRKLPSLITLAYVRYAYELGIVVRSFHNFTKITFLSVFFLNFFFVFPMKNVQSKETEKKAKTYHRFYLGKQKTQEIFL